MTTLNRISTARIIENSQYYTDLTRSNWSPIIQPSGVGDIYWKKLFQYYPEYQLFYENENGEWLGFANTIPVRYDGKLEDLPEEGWDWLISSGVNGYQKGIVPNMLGGLQIGVNPKYRRQGFSSKILEKAKYLRIKKGLKTFILPIRPTLKDQHPEVPLEDYMTWKENGKIYDPWIRTHMNSGASFVKICHKAMEVRGYISDWEQWTGKTFPQSGKYAVDGGLSLVDIDLKKNDGIYQEPNIWIYYD